MVKIFKGVPYTGTLPATLTGTKAGYLHRYKIYGNTEQTGTPTPENPIYPSECGERTENLFDKNATDTSKGYINNSAITSSGSIASNTNFYVSEYIRVSPNTNYSWKWTPSISSSTSISMSLYDDSQTLKRTISYGRNATVNLLTSSDETYVRVSVQKGSSDIAMLTEGSTAPSTYVPYGYKLPLLSGSTPVDIYLGESQTTRRIKKLVLTGEEQWYSSSRLKGSMFAYNSQFPGIKGAQAVYCSHLPYTSVSLYQYGTITTTYTDVDLWMFTETQSPAAFKTYLQQQYANGTPVTIWYILATEETGTLNEPLRKIGNYADTIDSTQTSSQIPTTANSTTISWAGSGLEPSEFDSIAEWVSATPKIYANGAWTDAQTYTYDDGAWVADNSN